MKLHLKFQFLAALLLPSLVTVTAASAVYRPFTLVAFDRSLRIRITPESSCDEPLNVGDVDPWIVRTRAPSTITRSGRSSSSSSTIQQSSMGIIHKDNAFLNVRGGAKAPSSSPSTNSFESLLAFSQGVFRDHVQPALADPENKILKPAKAFFEQQAANAQERRQQYQTHNNANDETSTAESATASTSASFILLQPARILRLAIVALVLAQVLETAGDNNTRIFSAWKHHAQPVWRDWTSNVQRWWKAARVDGVGLLSAATWSDPVLLSSSWKTQVSPKYQTAVGLGIGMVFSPVFWSAGEGLIRTGVGAYLVAEVLHQLLESPFWAQQQDWFSSKLGGTAETFVAEWDIDIVTTVRDALETWRQTVRDTVQRAQSVLQGDDDHNNKNYRFSSEPRRGDRAGLFPPHMRRGVLIGTVMGALIGV
jgi:hypothetical protein